MAQETEELPRIVCSSGAQFGGGQEEKVQVITLSPESGGSDGLSDITIMFYVHIYPYDTIQMSHEGTALAKFSLLARISGSQYMAKQCRATCL